MKTKLISTFAVLVLTLGLFLGFKISDNIFGSKSTGTYDVSNYVPQKSIVTDNVPVYTDDFDGDNTVVGLTARGYKAFNNSVPVGTTVWFQGNNTVFPAFNGPSTGYVGANFNATTGANTVDVWLISPKIGGGLLAGDSLVFWCRSTDVGVNYPDSVRVYLAPTGDSTATGTYTELGRFKAVNPPVGSGAAGYQRKAYRLGADAPNGRFVIRYYTVNGGPSGANTDYVGFDALKIERTAAPPPPNPTTWYEQTSGVATQLNSVSAPDINNVWVCGNAGVVRRTTNGGTWAAANGNLNADALYAIYAFDANNALVTSSPGATFVHRTTNGGANWTQVFTQAGGFIDSWYFKDNLNGLMVGDAVGGRSSIWKTTNGGATWDSAGVNFATPDASWNNAIYGDGNTVYWGTNATKVYKSTNFGTNWAPITTGTEVNGYAIWFNAPTTGLLGGATMQVSVNSGATWATLPASGAGNINAITGVPGSNNWWYTRAGLGVYTTTNNGTTWTTAYTAPAGNFVHMTKSRTGSPYLYGVRVNGGISKYGGSTTGVTPVTTIADNYSLSQNYPNPFNPSTSIKFALPTAGFTSLKVYNMLGKEVATLVSSNLSAGTYSFDFNASNLSSGVYFYKLEAGNFSEVKKMSLIK